MHSESDSSFEPTPGGPTQPGNATPSPANNADAAPLSPAIAATAPGQIRVIKRNGTVVPYTDDKIALALTKAFLAVEGGTAAASPRIRELVSHLTEQVTGTFKRRFPSGGTLHIEDIQDQVELALMRSGEHRVARDYVLYREDRARARAERRTRRAPRKSLPPTSTWSTKTAAKGPLDVARIAPWCGKPAPAWTRWTLTGIIDEALSNMYDGISAEGRVHLAADHRQNAGGRRAELHLRLRPPAARRAAHRGAAVPERRLR